MTLHYCQCDPHGDNAKCDRPCAEPGGYRERMLKPSVPDIVARLRQGTGDGLRAYDWMNEAADEIERLRAEVARCEASLLAWIEAVGECNRDRNRLREALENIAGMSREMEHTLYAATRVAAVALAAKEPGHD